ncbi:large conductance mechanosensitive channel [Nocardioides terrae]|uniref:Large conductance mechanosensitive channel n=1 Tax=Nocardioides terrae TaxID=574651 RepID=A0A1I1I6R3_9ACTN|nr:MscL family protein [Nocardioides terrae]SFC31977.1 large conductance mechanosensitive channel [Nocardioides terrae]
MSGFKNFLLRGNLIELAVAFIMGGAFATVVTATVALIMDLIGKVGDSPNFSNYTPSGIHVGAWLTALISFLILAAVVYFLIVVPYTKAKERYFPTSDEPGTPEDVALLTEIRDLLASRPTV